MQMMYQNLRSAPSDHPIPYDAPDYLINTQDQVTANKLNSRSINECSSGECFATYNNV